MYLVQVFKTQNPNVYASNIQIANEDNKEIKLNFSVNPSIFMYDFTPRGANNLGTIWTLNDINCHFYATGRKYKGCIYNFPYESPTPAHIGLTSSCSYTYYPEHFRKAQWTSFCLDLANTGDPDMTLFKNPNECFISPKSVYDLEFFRKVDTSTCKTLDIDNTLFVMFVNDVSPNMDKFDNPWDYHEEYHSMY